MVTSSSKGNGTKSSIRHTYSDEQQKERKKKKVMKEEQSVRWSLQPKIAKPTKKKKVKKTKISDIPYKKKTVRNSVSNKPKKKKTTKLFIERKPKKTAKVHSTPKATKTKTTKKTKKKKLYTSSSSSLASPQIIQELDRLLLSTLVDSNDVTNKNNDVDQELGNLLLTTLVGRISYPKFVYDDTKDKPSSQNEKEATKCKHNHDLITESLGYKDTTTINEELHQNKFKVRPKTRSHCTNNSKGHTPKTNDCNINSNKAEYNIKEPHIKEISDNSETKPNKKMKKKKRQSEVKNPHAITCVYRTEVQSDTEKKKQNIDHKVTSVYKTISKCKAKTKLDNDCSINSIKYTTKPDLVTQKKDSLDYLDTNSEAVTTIYRTDNDLDTVVESDNEEWSDIASKNFCPCKTDSGLAMENEFMKACDMVFDKFSDILFDTVLSDYSYSATSSTASTVTLTPSTSS